MVSFHSALNMEKQTRTPKSGYGSRTNLYAIINWPELAAKAHYHPSELAQLCKVSLRTVERFFRASWNLTPCEWLNRLRKHEAQKLADAGLRKKDIARNLGYARSSSLCHGF